MDLDDLSSVRARYADFLIRRAGVVDEPLRAAFARVPRERFLGPGPWRISSSGSYRESAGADPREVYVDALVALDAARGINNGEPSAHAMWIHALELKPGERVDHIGAGTGYYTAILAELVGARGRLEAYEIDGELAQKARAALADRPNVAVNEVSGVDGPLPKADAIYVNAGASAPSAVWLDALEPGGRLAFPLTDAWGHGGMLKITRAPDGSWPAQMISGAAFIGLVGGRDADESRAVHEAFRGGGEAEIRWLQRDGATSERDWARGDGWRLTR